MLPYVENTRLEAGIDEAGRGCLFGRVYAAIVILPPDFREYLSKKLVIKDSKKLSLKKRNELRKIIEENAIDYGVAFSEHTEIDKNNILQCTLKTMHKAIDKLDILPDILLVDGPHFIPYKKSDIIVPHKCIIDGDNKYDSIAAASILAKTYRDEYIENLCKDNTELQEKYKMLNNKGYGTKLHLEGIKEHGIIEGHRKTFGLCKKYI